MNFWKSSKGGGRVIFNPKIYNADFGNFKHEIDKKVELFQGSGYVFSKIVLILTDIN